MNSYCYYIIIHPIIVSIKYCTSFSSILHLDYRKSQQCEPHSKFIHPKNLWKKMQAKFLQLIKTASNHPWMGEEIWSKLLTWGYHFMLPGGACNRICKVNCCTMGGKVISCCPGNNFLRSKLTWERTDGHSIKNPWITFRLCASRTMGQAVSEKHNNWHACEYEVQGIYSKVYYTSILLLTGNLISLWLYVG